MTNPLAFFIGRGWSPAQAAGIVGNLGYEGGKANAVGDGGAAYGWAQLHPDRQRKFAQVMGLNIRGSSDEQQWAFTDWELRNTESKAGNLLRQQTTVAGATNVVMRNYERPAKSNYASLGDRIKMATSALSGEGLIGAGRDALTSVLGKDAGNAASDALQAGAQILENFDPFGFGSVAKGLGISGDCNYLCQFKNWISESGFFQRLALALVALILIAVGLGLLKNVRTTVVTAAKAAAV